jgi:hypothetical protein
MQCGKNKTIEIPRGNSAVLQIIPKISGEEHVISGGEKVIFTVKIFSAKTSEVKLQKTLTAENYAVRLHFRRLFCRFCPQKQPCFRRLNLPPKRQTILPSGGEIRR